MMLGLGFQTWASFQLMLMMLAWGFPSGQIPADAHDARVGVSNPGQLPADAHDARVLGFQTRASTQLMLMMLGCWGFKPGQLPADAHDARVLGFQTRASSQLMLMMLGCWG